jgi:hypothetical protein
MTVPHYVTEHTSEIRAIKSGWSNGKLSSGPYPNQGKCLTGIYRASPWLRRTIKCHVRPCTHLDEYGGREWIDNCCETCGHKLSLEEIGLHVVN